MDIKKILPIFSYIFHPIFISLYGTLFYFLITQLYLYQSQFYLTLLQVGILTLLLPISLYYLFMSLGVISSFTEATLKERKLPILIQAILLFVLIKFSASLDDLRELYYFFMGGFLSSLIAFLAVYIKFKASLHMIGISSLTTFAYALSLHSQIQLVNIILLLIITMGLVSSSRLYMKSHTPIELLIGTLIGIGSQVTFWIFWL
ncbi:Phosphatidic acid phosphatase type 2/haloperoxidase domain-containing protein [Flavobacterium jumunjinense]